MSRVLRCAVLDDYQDVAKQYADWGSLNGLVALDVFHEHFTDETELAKMLGLFEIIVLMRERTPFRRSLIARLPELKLLVTTGSRNGSIDLYACKDHGVAVCGTRSGTHAAAELTWALILAHQRHVLQEAVNLRTRGKWQSSVGVELAGRTLGVLGLGELGARVAKFGSAFGMEVLAWSQNLTDERCGEIGVRRAETLDALLQAADIVTVHLVLSQRTRHLIADKELELMKRTALLVNTSRAAIVSETALVRALENKTIGGAALDVFEQEPLPSDHPFRTMPQVTATPHIGYVTSDTYRAFFSDVVENIARWIADDPVRLITDPHPAMLDKEQHP